MTANHEIWDDFVRMADKRSAPHELAGPMVQQAKLWEGKSLPAWVKGDHGNIVGLFLLRWLARERSSAIEVTKIRVAI